VESLYASAQVTRTLLRIQGPISMEAAREFSQATAATCGEHRFGAALQTDGNLIALGKPVRVPRGRTDSDECGVARVARMDVGLAEIHVALWIFFDARRNSSTAAKER
jgi:hypothetical protein